MLLGVKRVQRVRWQGVLDETPPAADVDDWDDRPVRVVLDRDRARVASVAIDEIRKRDDAFVASGITRVKADDPRKVSLLRPELGRMRDLAQQMRAL
jgi:GTP1/Obg family GTP-binding protein